MTKRSPELLTAICDSVCASPSYANAARRNGITVSCLWQWLAQSQKGESNFVLAEYMGEPNIPFHEAMKMARKVTMASIVQNMEERALNGHWEPVFFKGEPTWVEDEDLVGLDEEELALLGYRDRYKRDQFGNRIQHRIHYEPPVSLQTFVAERQFPKLYGPAPATLNINSRSSSTAVVRHQLPAPPQRPPIPVGTVAAIPAPTPQSVADEEPDDLGLDEAMLPADGVSEEQAAAVASEPAPIAPEPMASEPTPASAPKALTPLQQDLLSRLHALQAKPPAAPAGPAPVRRVGLPPLIGRDEDDDRNPNRVGSGPTPPPGATKIV